jgi:hypothetical protein
MCPKQSLKEVEKKFDYQIAKGNASFDHEDACINKKGC